MRIAAIYDVHGNLDALEAVLIDVEQADPDLILFGGDVALGPLPRETLDRIMALGRAKTIIRGNTDRELIEGRPGAEEDVWAERRRWVAEQLSAEHRALLSGLPLTASRDIEGVGPTLFCHATPRNDEEIITRNTPEHLLPEVFAGVAEAVVVCGHTHMQFDRPAAGKRIVNAGSVGMPYEGRPGAYWALLGPDVGMRRTEYDVERAGRRIQASGFPGAEDFVHKILLNPPGPDEITARFESMAEARRAGTTR